MSSVYEVPWPCDRSVPDFGDAYNFYFTVPPRGYAKLAFSFNAEWSNMIWVYAGESKEKVVDTGNGGGGMTEWTTGLNATGLPITYGIIAWHKRNASPGISHGERFPWSQSQIRRRR